MDSESVSQAPSGGQLLLRGAARQLNQGEPIMDAASQLAPQFNMIDVVEAELLLIQPGVGDRLAGYQELRMVVGIIESKLAGGAA